MTFASEGDAAVKMAAAMQMRLMIDEAIMGTTQENV
jgi:hypothetical protein